MKQKRTFARLSRPTFLSSLIFAVSLATPAQVGTGGTYTLDHAVVASGGGQNAAGVGFSVDGTIGQPAAGVNLSGSPFAVAGGFWTAEALAPSAAMVAVSGRILIADGRGLRNARLILTDPQGIVRTAVSGSFGYFRFDEVEVGQTYVLLAASKRFQFTPLILNVVDTIADLEFVAQPSPEQ